MVYLLRVGVWVLCFKGLVWVVLGILSIFMVTGGAPLIDHTTRGAFTWECAVDGDFGTGLLNGRAPCLEDPVQLYRPVSMFATHSKIFEPIMFDQLCDHFGNIFNTYLAAFRKDFGCQTTLLRLLEVWKRELDNQRYVRAILMDLSRAFDCLSHGLIIDKLAAYGLSVSACSLLQSYLSHRKQMVKLGHCKKNLEIILGVPGDPSWDH